MEETRWIPWSRWGDCGMEEFGQMPVRNVDNSLREFREKATQVLRETGADHVVYGAKLYDENDVLDMVKFYMLPIDDESFQKDVETLKHTVVYAVHARK